MDPGHLAILVLFPLLQVPAVLYLGRYFEVEDPEPRMPEFRADRPETNGRDGTCRRCGASNDPEFTFCRRCVEPLPS